jgi:hypothetical protein
MNVAVDQSRSDRMNVAVGFNPRFREANWRTSRVATAEHDSATFRRSIVATRLVRVLATALRGLKTTATFDSRYAANTKNPGRYSGRRSYDPRKLNSASLTPRAQAGFATLNPEP